MFASIRCYFVHKASTDELVRLVEDEFADRIAAQPGFVSYVFLDCGGGDAMTISVFREPDQAAASRELAQRWSEERVGEFELTTTEALHGAVPVSRATPELLAERAPDAPPRFARVPTGSQRVTSASSCGGSWTRDWPSGWRSWTGSPRIWCSAAVQASW
jgi:hypothetical protein